jgi:hypothetical protein
MATFSQQFLANLGRPAMTESLFGLGQTIGGVPGQLQQRKQRREEAGMLAGLTPGSVEYNQAMAKVAQQRGELERAAQFGTAAEQQRRAADEQRAERGALQSQLQSLIQNKQASPAMKQQALSLLKRVATDTVISDTLKQQVKTLGTAAAAPAGQNFVVAGNRVFDRNTGQFISPTEAADELNLKDLKEIATPESIVEYAQTGDRNVLVPLAGEDEGDGQARLIGALQTVDNTLATADKALGISEDYWKLTYPLAQFVPTTSAMELDTYVTTLQSSLAFDRLQKMRDQSKTGGALGQVSNIELGLLQASVAALNPASSNFEEQLKTVRRSYEDFKDSLLGKVPQSDQYVLDPETNILYYVDGNEYTSLGVVQP